QAFVQLVKKCSNCHFMFIGDGPLLEQYKATVKDLQLEHRVHFLGFRRDVERFYKMADATVLPSYSEGFPLVLLESARAKIPVITTNVGAVKKLVKDQSYGWKIEPGSVGELLQAMEQAFYLQKEGKLEK